MSIIAVSGLPPKWDLKTVVKKLLKTINGKFEALSIINNKKTRKCYIRLSERLDPQLVCENINKKLFGPVKLQASVPIAVPDLPMHVRPRKIPMKVRRAMNIPEESTPGEVIFTAHTEIMIEMQSKYNGLYELSEKTNHQLLTNIARTILDRMKEVLIASPDVDNGFKMTKSYRKSYPHFGDFQLIVTSLHQIEDAEGKARTQLNKQDFSNTNVHPYVIENVPYNKVNEICRKYTKQISAMLTEHANNLDTDFEAAPDSEEEATKKVRLELKKMSSYFPAVLHQVISANFVPEKASFYKIRMYGDPFLPTKENMAPFLKRCRAMKVFRSDRIFNMLLCRVPLNALHLVVAADGTVVAGATIFVRLLEMPSFRVPEEIKLEILSIRSEEELAADTIDMEDAKEWSEEW